MFRAQAWTKAMNESIYIYMYLYFRLQSESIKLLNLQQASFVYSRGIGQSHYRDLIGY